MTPSTPTPILAFGRRVAAVLLVLVGAFLLAQGGTRTATSQIDTRDGVILLDIKGAIGPATADFMTRGLERARDEGARLVVLRMDTPGGLDSAMRDMIQAILASPVPVASYVAPSGARAASAGTYILYASHVAAMAPGTTLGAATPVQMGAAVHSQIGADDAPDAADNGTADSAPEAVGDDEAGGNDNADAVDPMTEEPALPGMAEKTIEDAAAYMRGLASMRGRNAEWAEKAVREAASLSSSEALEMNVIDIVARNLPDLLEQADGRVVDTIMGEVELELAGLSITEIEPDWRTRLLSVITDPNVAYILMIVGIYGIIFEFYNPGMFVPGVAGAICLLLALYAFQVLPVNYAGAGLIALGILLLIGESLMPSFGVLGIGGVIAFVVGSVLLIDTEIPGFGISWYLIGGVAVVNAGFFMFVLSMALQSQRRRVVAGREAMIGQSARIVDWEDGRGHVRVHGEIWSARGSGAIEPGPFEPGTEVRVDAIDGLTLVVAPPTETR